MDVFPFPMQLGIVAILGLVLGSFATALVYRIPRNINVIGASERSKCPVCNTQLGALDLVPVFSWLLSWGKCRHCGAPISTMYPLTELLTVAICVVSYVVFYQNPLSASLLILSAPIIAALFVIDLEHKLLPNALVFGLAVLGAARFAVNAFETQNITAISIEYIGGALLFGLFALILGLLMQFLLKKQALGMGDVKFFAVSGLWIGLSQLPSFCILAGILGLILGMAWKIIKKEAVFPFGPALIAAFLLVIWTGGSLLP